MVSNEEKAAAAAASITTTKSSDRDNSSSTSSSSSNTSANTTTAPAPGQHSTHPSPRLSPRVSPRVSPGAPSSSVPLSPQAAAAAAAAALAARAQSSSFSIDKTEEFVFTVPEEAPVFVPTVEEFKNPLTYINKIRPIAEKYGICKIRPPSTWQPPFTVNVDKLRFTPRVQRLNELEAKTRVKLNFLDQIAKFWELQGSSLKIPMVERKALDLYSLHRLVQDEGGLDQATRDRKWSNIASRMGYPSGKSVGTILKGHYERILYPFDLFTLGEPDDKMKAQQKLETEPEGGDHDYKPHGIVSRQKVMPPRDPTARRSQRIDAASAEACAAEDRKIKEEQDAESTAARSAELRRLKFYGAAGMKAIGMKQPTTKQENGAAVGPKSRMNGAGSQSGGGGAAGKRGNHRRMNLDPLAKYICHICNRGDVEEAMLLCDGCDDSYHTFCLMPPLLEIPKGEWRCPKCVVEEVSKPTEAFGFEQAQREYTLQQFGEMADQFKAEYFNIPVHLVPTQMVEREFWRIVSSIDEDVVVEYGADLHTMDHGSGFPTKSSLYLLPGDQEYAESSWNLNNLPLLEESILGHINADISGMKVPWMYVGMCFATFCWHNEDHWSYSINYLHWGEPKTWYGVPGSKAEAFEKTMKRAAPELFQSQPDLLHQLVTIMNPNILMTDGVPVYRTDQHAGEFIITFPRAYHAGFNQGYNFAEAVNFAPADWMKIGRECINHYSTLRRFCVFSHDELVCKMALDPDKLNLGIATACYLDMAEMVDCEKKLRKSLLEWGVTKAEREAFELIPDDERQCEVCKTTCFLSAVTCGCVKSLVCLRHYSELCKCQPEKHTLKYRYTLDELPLMLRKLKVKAESFENWLSKVRDVIDPNTPTVITLDELQELAQEAEDKKFPGSVLLERLNSAVLEAEKCVTVIQQLDINKMRTRTRNSCEFAKYKLTLEELDLFVQEIDNLCCIIPEGNSVRELQQMGTDFVDQCQALLKHDLIDIDEDDVKRLLDEGSSLCIELPQLKTLKYLHDQLHWYNDVRELRESGDKIPLATMKRLLEQGLSLAPHGTLEKELAELQSIMISVEMWEASATLCFQNDTQHELRDVEQLLAQADHIEGNLPSQPTLRDALRKAKEWLASVDQLQNNENYPYLHTIETVIHRGRNIPFQLAELRRMEDHVVTAVEWKERVSKTFLRKNAHFTLLDALSPRPEAVMLADHYPRHLTEAQYVTQFSEDTGPVQVVIAFKNAEEKELSEMRALRTANAAKCPETDRFCLCRRRFSGNMLNCQLCQDWFHESCVPVPKRKVRPRVSQPGNTGLLQQTGGGDCVPRLTERERDREIKFLCPSCMRSRRPRLETILLLLMSLQRLPIRLPEGEALQCLTERAMNWQDRARQALATPDVVAKLAALSEIAQRQQAALGKDSSKVTQAAKKVIRARRASETSDSSMDLDEVAATGEPAGDKSVEHAYSTGTAAATATGAASASDQSGLITLSESTRTWLLELLMEGDLLEVCLDETQHLWRILNAAKPSSSDLTLINLRYKIMPHPTEDLVTSRKPTDEDSVPNAAAHNIQTPAAAPARKSGKLNRSAAAAGDHLAAQSPLTPHNNGGTAGQTGSAGSTTATASGGGSNSKQQLKRGRKLKMSAEKPSVGAAGGAASAATAAATTTTPTATPAATSAAQKKKRGRKSVPENQNQTPTAASTSDEEEECSATNCVRPAGREVDWVQCDGGCNKWYHMYCVGLVKNQIKPDDDYVCRKCKKQSNTEAAAAAAASAAPTANTTTTTNPSTNPTSASAATTATNPLSGGTSKAKQRFEEDFPDGGGAKGDDDDDEEDDDEADDDEEDDDDDEEMAEEHSATTATTMTTGKKSATTATTAATTTTTSSSSSSSTTTGQKNKASSEATPTSSSKKLKL